MADRPIEASAAEGPRKADAMVLADPATPAGVPGKPYLGINYSRGSLRLRDLSKTQLEVRDAILAGDSASDYEEAPCLCGSTGPDVLLASVERHGLDCRNVVCARCGLVRISPRWNEGRYGRFYENEYRNLYNRIQASKEDFARSTSKSPWVLGFGAWVKSAVGRHGGLPEPRVLEIGAGAGWNLSNLPSSWKRTGFDVDREYLELGERLFGLTMKFGLLAEALADVPRADVIILSHVVEHFPDPRAALESIVARMRPTALLLIEVPGIFRIHGTALDPMTYLQNAHTYTFCARTLQAVCLEASLEVLEGDEICRAACRPSARPVNRPPEATLASATLRYLRMCEAGVAVQRRFKAIPVAGRYLAALWKRAFFPWLGLLVPKGSAK